MSEAKYYLETRGEDFVPDLLFRVLDDYYLVLAWRSKRLNRWTRPAIPGHGETGDWVKSVHRLQEITKEETAMILFQCGGPYEEILY